MNVIQHEVVTDYLASREDREKFNYFRIIDENNQKRFVLTYGIYNSPQEAIGASRVIQFNLPNGVSTFPEEFKLFASQMDEYEISPALQEIGKNAPKAINLSPTRKELPAKSTEPKPVVEKPKESIENSVNANDTLAVEEKQVINPNPLLNDHDKPTTPKENRLTNTTTENPNNPAPKNMAEPEQKLPQPIPVKPIDKPIVPHKETSPTPDLPIPTPVE